MKEEFKINENTLFPIREEKQSLSEKIWVSEFLKSHLEFAGGLKIKNKGKFFFAEDVKKAVKELKEEIKNFNYEGYYIPKRKKQELQEIIDKIFGEKLTK